MYTTLRSLAAIIFVLPLLLPGRCHAQSTEGVRAITYSAYVKGEAGLWDRALELSMQEYKAKKDSGSLYELLMVQYGYAAFCVNKKYRERGLMVIRDGRENVDLYLDGYPDDPGAMAIKAAFLVFEGNLRPAKMITQAGEGVRLSDRAYTADSSNLMALSGRANQLRFSPPLFGGSVDRAIPLYKRIIDNYDSGVYDRAKDWMYINTMVALAGSYEKKKMYAEACVVYKKIIAFDGDIGWVSEGLYPACRKKAGEAPPGGAAGGINNN